MESSMSSTSNIISKENSVSSMVTDHGPISSANQSYSGSYALCIGWSKYRIEKDSHNGDDTSE